MSRTQVNALIDSLVASYKEAAETVAKVSNTHLDTPVAGFQGRVAPLRGSIYNMVWHPREHVIHLNKVLQESKAPTATPNEAQAILAESGQAIGQLIGLLARLNDEDLDRSFEDQTPRKVIEHVRGTFASAKTRSTNVLEGKVATP